MPRYVSEALFREVTSDNALALRTYTTLLSLRRRIDRALRDKRNGKQEATKERLIALARQSGFEIKEIAPLQESQHQKALSSFLGAQETVEVVVEEPPPPRRSWNGGKVAPKYQDPRNPNNVWSGRGRTPRWMAAQLAANKKKTKEDFLIR